MKNIFVLSCLVLLFGWCAGPQFVNGQIVDFDDLSLSANSYFDGYGSGASAGSWATAGLSFNTQQYGPGWSYSNVDDSTTAGYTNQWATTTGTGFGGSGNYVLANSYSPNGAFINLPEAKLLESLLITNSTYAAISMANGDAYAKQFGGASGNDEDYFKVTFTGFAGLSTSGLETGTVDFFLADYRFSDNSLDYIVNQWETVNLSALGNARSVAISLESSDVGAFGMNTPAYVAMDQFSLTAVPEPNSLGLIVVAAAWLMRRRRKC